MYEFLSLIDRALQPHRQMMLQAERDLWAHPETGYREWYASSYLKERFEALGYQPVMAGNIPGFYADLETGHPGPTIAIFGEMDSLICANHPESNPENGYVHACGHHAQCAALLGIAAALRTPELRSLLCGKVRLIAVPAEELLELGYRKKLKEQGIIKYFGGKVEFLYRGYLDGVDAAFMVHSSASEQLIGFPLGSNGCLSKNITYQGKSAHAGGSPQNGINALYAANLGLSAINALRETFVDEDHIRVHPIITAGGSAVNAIPETVSMESYVRGATLDSIVAANEKVNRALAASALALGANVEISDLMGYFPLNPNEDMKQLGYEIACALFGKEQVYLEDSWGTGCTDMGDIASVMPALHPYAAGAVGHGHGADYYIEDPEKAVIGSAKFQLALLCGLLEEEGRRAYAIKQNAKLRFASYADYFKAVDALELEQQAIAYETDGGATVRWKKENA